MNNLIEIASSEPNEHKEGNMTDLLQTKTDQIVVFTLDDLSYALPLPAVLRVIHVVEIRHLPKAPEIIAGIINVGGRIIPVVDIRKRLGLGAREIDINDRLIITDTGKREVAILVDSVTGITDLKPRQMEIARETLAFAEHILGVAKVDDGLILIYNLERFLSLDEEKGLEKSLQIQKQ
jgi:purine-binding chemotaxis protein CheW